MACVKGTCREGTSLGTALRLSLITLFHFIFNSWLKTQPHRVVNTPVLCGRKRMLMEVLWLPEATRLVNDVADLQPQGPHWVLGK